MARNKSVGMKVFAIAGKSFLIVIMLMLVGMISYKFTMKYYEVTEGEDATGSGVLDIVGDVSADEISRNVIFSVDSESGKIKDPFVIGFVGIDQVTHVQIHNLTDAGTGRTHPVGVIEREIRGRTDIRLSDP